VAPARGEGRYGDRSTQRIKSTAAYPGLHARPEAAQPGRRHRAGLHQVHRKAVGRDLSQRRDFCGIIPGSMIKISVGEGVQWVSCNIYDITQVPAHGVKSKASTIGGPPHGTIPAKPGIYIDRYET
jgi:hypothetical protein